jgi:DNA-directed RNA polymerase subunit alpha
MLQPIFSVKIDQQDDKYGKFVYEPFNNSFAHSIGNALRRTLLSSLPGSAAGYVKFKTSPHLFSTIKGVKESVLDIALNIKQIRFKNPSSDRTVSKLSSKGLGKIYAKDIVGEANVVNGEQYIAEITDPKAELDFEIIVVSGYGYQPSEEKVPETDFISLDSAFSPIVKVNFNVEEARVGRKTDYERLILEVWTDGTVKPFDAVKKASEILASHFSSMVEGKVKEEETSTNISTSEVVETRSPAYETIIDELNLPSRVINALLRENIETVSDLVERGKEDLTNLKGVGRKSIDLIIEEVAKMGVELK